MSSEPDLVVTAFDKRYLAAFDRVIRVEGGFVNDPDDPGGATQYGVSLRFLVNAGKVDSDFDGRADFDLDMDGDIDVADIRLLTVVNAKWLFQRFFWFPVGAADFAAPIGEAMFDQAVNGGLIAAKKLLQTAVNICIGSTAGRAPDAPAPLEVDGDLGNLTRAAFDWSLRRPDIGAPLLIAAYRLAAAERYHGLVARNRALSKYLTGWLRRAADLGRGA